MHISIYCIYFILCRVYTEYSIYCIYKKYIQLIGMYILYTVLQNVVNYKTTDTKT